MQEKQSLTPAQRRIIGLLETHREKIKGGRVAWHEIEIITHWPSHVLRQQVQLALNIVGASTVEELIEKYNVAKEAATHA